MKKIFIFSFFALISMKGMPQAGTAVTVNAGPDKCANPTATLTATATVTGFPSTSSYVPTQPAYNWITLPSPTTFLNNANRVGIDDTWFTTANIGFPFSFYGTTYTQLCIGINGRVTFDLSKLHLYEDYEITSYLPGPVSPTAPMPDNTICALYRDLDPLPLTGQISVQTIGTAPCRKFVIIWSMPLYKAKELCIPRPPTQSFQLVLNESTNIIEVNVQVSSACTNPGWNNAAGIIGIQSFKNNVYSTCAIWGHNGPGWSSNSESWRFTPNGTTTQTPYTGTITWTGPSGVIGTGSSINVSPTSATTYTATASINNCNGTYSGSDQVFVNKKADPEFTIATNRPAGSPFYTITATAVATTAQYPGLAFDWYIEEVDAGGSTVANTAVYNPQCWWYYPTQNYFVGYDYNVIYTSSNNSGTGFNGNPCINTNAGKFRAGSRYKITHGVWTNECGYQNISHTVYISARPSGDDMTIIDEEQVNATLDVYPNPSTGSFTVNIENNDLKDIYVYDAMGRIVYSRNNATEQSFQIDVTQLPKGLYLVKVISNNKMQVQKVISE
jgi:hypothetical protein